MKIIEDTSSLETEDWYFYSIFALSDYKLSPFDLQHNWTYIEVTKIREYLMIEKTKEEAYHLDMKLMEGKP
jgi:hypothetical protein